MGTIDGGEGYIEWEWAKLKRRETYGLKFGLNILYFYILAYLGNEGVIQFCQHPFAQKVRFRNDYIFLPLFNNYIEILKFHIVGICTVKALFSLIRFSHGSRVAVHHAV